MNEFENTNNEEAEQAQILTLQASMNAVAKHQAAMAKQREQESLMECDDCVDEIPEARRIAIQGVQRCIYCQEALERKMK
jgi:phage/conjugal plasmid C-4 type zinc finger TraR family protein